MLNIVIPMAGRGSRFAQAGFTVPKPLIPLGGKPMIQWVIDNVRPVRPHRFIFLCLQEHLNQYPEVPQTLRELCPGCEIIPVPGVTEGAACTVLLARTFINCEHPLMIANSDQFVDLPMHEYLAFQDETQADGLIMTFWADHPKWSYCRMTPDDTVSEVVEKKVISHEATVGIYNFRRGSDYVRAADDMVARNLRVNNEFYVAPTYNFLIQQGQTVRIKRTGKEYQGMYGLGTPDDFHFFETTEAFIRSLPSSHPHRFPIPEARLSALTQRYVAFFHQKNLPGIEAMLAENVRLIDPSADLVGKVQVLDYVAKLFSQHPDLSFNVENIFVDAPASIVEFILRLGGKTLHGTDVIQWEKGRIQCIRAYLC